MLRNGFLSYQTVAGAYYLGTHTRVKHSERATCDICGKTGIKKEKLAAHKIDAHLPDNERPFICSYCGKGFAHKTKLESHEVI